MDPLRWKYMIQINLEKPEKNVRSKGFLVRPLEGQSRTIGEPFPLNQIEIRSDTFNLDFRAVVGSKVTQIYVSIKEMPSMDEFENMLDNLDKVENILNEIVFFAPNENSRFNMKTRKPVMSVGILKTQKMLNDRFNDTIQKITVLAIKEFSKANSSLAQGKIAAPTQVDSILGGLVKIQRELIQSAKEQGKEWADKYERELNEMLLYSKLFEADLRLAKSQGDIRRIIEKYSKLFDFS